MARGGFAISDMSGTSILWFKRDLRLEDHPALCEAARAGRPILPLFMIEPAAWGAPTASSRHYHFMAQALRALHDDIVALGGTLCVRRGQALDILSDLKASLGQITLYSHEETGEVWSYQRDRAVARWCRAEGVTWHEVPQSAVQRRLASRSMWQRRYNGFMQQPVLARPPDLRWAHAGTQGIPRWEDVSRSDPLPDVPHVATRKMALSRLSHFLNHGAQTYQADMATPLKAPQACSRLSEYFAWGVISPRDVSARLSEHISPEPRPAFARGYRSFQARLAWRDHFIQKLEDQPDLEHRAMHSAFEGLRPRGQFPERLQAFELGMTGVPFIDACMRCLRETGWINFRARAMLMSFAAYNLWLDWREAGQVLARYFIDYEPGIHWSQVQMQSGVTGMNTIRVYNPIKQGQDQDPQGIFTRHWVPELRDMPLEFLQTPWAAPLFPSSYVPPIVDVGASAKAARDVLWGMKRDVKCQPETRAVIAKHASRKRPAPRQRTRAAKPPPQGDQMSFDF